jgi:hypothetical protein
MVPGGEISSLRYGMCFVELKRRGWRKRAGILGIPIKQLQPLQGGVVEVVINVFSQISLHFGG